MGGECSTYGRVKKLITKFSLSPEEKRSLRKPCHRRKTKIKTDLRRTLCRLNSFRSRKVSLQGSCEHNNVPSGSIKSGQFID